MQVWAKALIPFNVIELGKITQIVAFIFLAPIIGMIISMLITFVTMMRNVWLRIAVILVMAGITFVMFDHFEQNKMKEAVEVLQNWQIEEKSGRWPCCGSRPSRQKLIIGKIEPLYQNYDEIEFCICNGQHHS